MAQSLHRLTTTSSSRVQTILLPQLPEKGMEKGEGRKERKKKKEEEEGRKRRGKEEEREKDEKGKRNVLVSRRRKEKEEEKKKKEKKKREKKNVLVFRIEKTRSSQVQQDPERLSLFYSGLWDGTLDSWPLAGLDYFGRHGNRDITLGPVWLAPLVACWFMNHRVPAHKRYQPTEYEHAANCATHAAIPAFLPSFLPAYQPVFSIYLSRCPPCAAYVVYGK
ncbi:Monocyte to macrophage differentiation factor 2 [Plecturocebus cupreus]